MNLELGLVDPPPVESWADFAKRADELEGEYFVLAPECRAELATCSYFNASRLWNFSQRLAEGARRRRIAGWNASGPLALWLRDQVGLEIALTDPRLGNTSFIFNGREMSWEPHVKVDDAKDELIHLGRIYFAIDDEQQRLVVRHIGLHR